jgi:hypothetical protein
MILETVYSVNGVPIRLTEERWEHIVDEHPYMTSYYEAVLAAVEQPQYILRGRKGVLVAVTSQGRRKFLHVIYRELGKQDGFIITAFIQPDFERAKVIWREENQ